MKVAIVVASIGRPEDINMLFSNISKQSLRPDFFVVSAEKPDDIPQSIVPSITKIYGSRGASIQRNRGIDAVIDICDIIIFLDDDYVPCKDFIERTVRFFKDNSDVVGATGLVISDGVKTGGISYDMADSLIKEYNDNSKESKFFSRAVRTAYGCNMVFRSSAIKQIRFDERLPLHSWQEDVDFACRVSWCGKVVYTNYFFGVHCGVARARSNGIRVGYSQIANPFYLIKKGTISKRHAFRIMSKNIVANHLKIFFPEKYIDRAGRAKGNWTAIYDLLTFKLDPMKICEL